MHCLDPAQTPSSAPPLRNWPHPTHSQVMCWYITSSEGGQAPFLSGLHSFWLCRSASRSDQSKREAIPIATNRGVFPINYPTISNPFCQYFSLSPTFLSFSNNSTAPLVRIQLPLPRKSKTVGLSRFGKYAIEQVRIFGENGLDYRLSTIDCSIKLVHLRALVKLLDPINLASSRYSAPSLISPDTLC